MLVADKMREYRYNSLSSQTYMFANDCDRSIASLEFVTVCLLEFSEIALGKIKLDHERSFHHAKNLAIELYCFYTFINVITSHVYYVLHFNNACLCSTFHMFLINCWNKS